MYTDIEFYSIEVLNTETNNNETMIIGIKAKKDGDNIFVLKDSDEYNTLLDLLNKK
jgi:hypothetical protein